MSWIFGVVGKSYDHSRILKYIHNKVIPSKTFSSKNFFITAGGNEKTLRSSINENNGWIVTGIGLSISDNSTKILSSPEWNIHFRNDIFSVDKIDGHFAAMRWKNNKVHLYTDLTGLRDFFVSRDSNGSVFFSTQLNLLSGLANSKIDFKTFGSRWLLFNQISSKSIVNGIVRLNKGKSAEISNSKFQIFAPSQNNLLVKHAGNPVDKFSSKINAVLNCWRNNHKLILALSGGLDSRLLLSYLIKYHPNNFEAVTFGDINHPDAKIAQMMAKQIGFKHTVIDFPLPDGDELISRIQNAASFWQAVNPVSVFTNLGYYHKFTDNSIIVDGGFGEIWRMEFLKRFQLFGKRLIEKNDLKSIIRILSFGRANIFNEETTRIMKQGLFEQIQEMIDYLPALNKIKFYNWVDLFSFNTRLPNFYAPEQQRLDSMVTSFMPFIQNSLTQFLFGIQKNERKNGSLFKKLIKQNSRKLIDFPLATGDFIHPFGLSSLQTRLWSKFAKAKKHKVYSNRNKIILFDKLKPFILDVMNSSGVKQYPHYDYKIISGYGDKYFNGNKEALDFIDWFISFELFRKSLE